MNNHNKHRLPEQAGKAPKKPFRLFWPVVLLGLLLGFFSCDFQSPAEFEMPTWFMDLTIPLIQERYYLGDMVDEKQIFSTDDSLGMQIIFVGDLPDTSIDASYLQVELNQDERFLQEPAYAPNLSFSYDTLVTIEIPFAPNNQFVDVNLDTFDIPAATDKQIFAATWNQIAAAFDTTFQIDIEIPQVDEDDLPEFISSVEAIVITGDSDSDSSMFLTTLLNNGLPTAVKNIEFSLLTDLNDPYDSLALHTENRLTKDNIFSEHTLLGDKRLGSTIRMQFGFGLEEETTLDTIVINAGDSVKVNLSFRIRIAGVDEAIVEVSEYDLSPAMPAMEFPSDIEIYSGIFADPSSGFGVNEITISELHSSLIFDIDYTMNFRNFVPPTGEDSVIISTVLSRDSSAYSRTFDIDGYSFVNPTNPDSALTEMVIDISAVIQEQTAALPLDGSDLGQLGLRVQVEELQFSELQANLIQTFPPTEQAMTGMPEGFSGMAFTNVKIEFIMLNQIQLPVVLDLDMIGVNTFGDSSVVRVRASMGSPDNADDTCKTIIRLSREGTTTLIYDSPGATTWTDSTTVPPGRGESTIVDLLSFNPENLLISSAARIDGRGTIVVGASIGGSYRLIAPFEVLMSPMTFIPVNESPLEEWDYELRNTIRSSLRSATMVTRVINHIPVGGEITILMSNQSYFPLELSRKYLDSLAVAMGIDLSSGDSLYAVTDCDQLDPALTSDSSIYIFNVLSDYTDCMDGPVYIVRGSASGTDTLVTYIDTLLNIILPDPQLVSYDNDYTDPRLVGEASDETSASILDTSKIKLLTGVGERYTTPRFHLSGSPIDPISGDSLSVYLSVDDYVEIQSYMTFEISSTGLLESAPDELVITYPNGGETLGTAAPIIIRWRTYGKVKKVNLDYSTTTNPEIGKDDLWTPLTSNWTAIANVDSFVWDASAMIGDIDVAQRDSIRIRVSDNSSSTADINGWYITLQETARAVQSRTETDLRTNHPKGKVQ